MSKVTGGVFCWKTRPEETLTWTSPEEISSRLSLNRTGGLEITVHVVVASEEVDSPFAGVMEGLRWRTTPPPDPWL